MLCASVDMLEHLGHKQHAELIEKAINKTVCVDRIHTPGMYISLYKLQCNSTRYIYIYIFSFHVTDRV